MVTKRATSKSKTSKRDQQIHVLTDGTGGLPRHFLTAILSQFPQVHEPPKYHVFCDSVEKTEEVFRKSVKKQSIVLHAFADARSKNVLSQLASERQIPCYDLTGGAASFLAEQLGCEPLENLKRVHAPNADYFNRIDAWEFTMQHDDSRRLESIGNAQIVLMGVSRVSKTPTAAYLGWLGYRVANVSLVPDAGAPKEIKKCKRKTVALTMKPRRLAEIRSRRLEVNGFAEKIDANPQVDFQYSGVRETIREVMDAEAIYQELGIPMIDVTDTTVEETAARVLQLLKLN